MEGSMANSSLALRDGTKFVNILKDQLRVGGGSMLLAGERGSGKFVILTKMLQESKMNGVTCLIGQSGIKGGSREAHNLEMTEWKEVTNGLMFAVIDGFVDSLGEYITLLRLKSTTDVVQMMLSDNVEQYAVSAFKLWASSTDANDELGPWAASKEWVGKVNVKWEDIFDSEEFVADLVAILHELLPETHHDEMPCLGVFFKGISRDGSGSLRRRAEHKGKQIMHDPFSMRPFFGFVCAVVDH